MTLDLARASRLAWVAHGLAPPSAGLPGAGALEGWPGQIDSVLEICPGLVAPVAAALDALPSAREPHAALEALEARDPGAVETLFEVVAMAWATSPAVCAALGYRGQAALETAGRSTGEELLGPVLARGARWRRP